jgi:hypothetical protein
MRYVWNETDHDHGAELREMLAEAQSLDVICPYLREHQVEEIIGSADLASIRVITLWSPQAFLSGATELQASKLLLRLGAQIRGVRAGLHAKVFIVKGTTALVTSANLTTGGMASNLECGISIERQDISELSDRFALEWSRSAPITEEMIDSMLEELDRRRQEAGVGGLAPSSGRARGRYREAVTRSSGRVDKALRRDCCGATPDHLEYITRLLRGQGGYQSFLSHLQVNLSGNQLRLTRADCEKVVRYATQYGEGGFQGRLRAIVDLARAFLGGQ